ncbi:hypothetical protein ADIAL_1803 [Alkalibacterium sp. AK22]|uniref:VanZ family protein n=1 Tax=Alkalibacterium sp. AK22 TaxID=1229520 RepID=UPI00044D89A5|nr:VanZ family protein [Alkalibacterium sp. AK22]EXJ22781.1 hypothetical protein ADIAL_1803 [Alkalibacterium sp. AK22]
MKSKASTADNLFLLMAFVVMGILYYSSSMSYQDQSIQSNLQRWLANEPLRGLLEGVRFTYAGSEVSIEASSYIGFIEFFIRKAAHFISYFFLGLFWFLGLRNRMDNVYLTLLISVMLSAGYASFDELRQSFNPDRSALMEDVVLDTAGAIAGSVIALVSARPRSKGSRRRAVQRRR